MGHRLWEKHNLRIFRVMLKCSTKDEPILSFSSFIANASHGRPVSIIALPREMLGIQSQRAGRAAFNPSPS